MPVFKVKIMRKLGPRREKVTGGWRDLSAKKLCNLYFYLIFKSDKIKENDMDGICNIHWGYKIHVLNISRKT
jgi:hypothetical protein